MTGNKKTKQHIPFNLNKYTQQQKPMQYNYSAHINTLGLHTEFTVIANPQLINDQFIMDCAKDAIKENCQVSDDDINDLEIDIKQIK